MSEYRLAVFFDGEDLELRVHEDGLSSELETNDETLDILRRALDQRHLDATNEPRRGKLISFWSSGDLPTCNECANSDVHSYGGPLTVEEFPKGARCQRCNRKLVVS